MNALEAYQLANQSNEDDNNADVKAIARRVLASIDHAIETSARGGKYRASVAMPEDAGMAALRIIVADLENRGFGTESFNDCITAKWTPNALTIKHDAL